MSEYQHGRCWEKLKRISDEKLRKYMIIFTIGYGTGGLVAIVVMYVDMYLENDELDLDIPGVYWKGLPFMTWFPFNAHESIAAYLGVYALQVVYATLTPLTITGAILLFFFAAECLLNHVKLLVFSLQHLDQRAKAMFQERYKHEPDENSEPELELCYYECIAQNIKHHHNLLREFNEMVAVADYAVAVPFFAGAFFLGLCGLNLISEGDTRLSPKCVSLCLGATEGLNMLLICHYGEAFQQESEKLFGTIIGMKWHKRSMKCRRALMLLQLGCYKPLKITVGKMIALDMKTFSNLVNSAYSIFNLSALSKGND
ncbi:hypothetical protein GE061_009175 [Apolygus lucorum]|uniref:Uncharacterized protein n=1 Tax=Apolygus lucorum TaxID=248454 RepID=A0A6A4KHU4_APOLU|nr:hypothetical protein GE061_009175 [Apolygus lucorum]